VRLLVALDVLGQRVHQAHRVLGRDDDAALDPGLLHARHHANEVENELLGRVGDHDEVGVGALGRLLVHFEVELFVLGGGALLLGKSARGKRIVEVGHFWGGCRDAGVRGGGDLSSKRSFSKRQRRE
jgi:hypothetical protein